MKKTLTIVGTPLNEDAVLSPEAAAALSEADVIIGETRKVTSKHCKRAGVPEGDKIYSMDPPREDEMIREALAKATRAVLLSDCGMPILFDPGLWVLEHCRAKGFAVSVIPSATSWATAVAVSGFSEPFAVLGFPPRDNAARLRFFEKARAQDVSVVLMDTPYRFRLLLQQAGDAFGRERPAFLAWEIGKPEAKFTWGTLGEIASLGLDRGEFVLVVRRR